MKNIDIKSILIGILATTTFFLATGHSNNNPNDKDVELGRYQFEVHHYEKWGGEERLFYVMDTKTKKVTAYSRIKQTDGDYYPSYYDFKD